jgi:hypothetical protein
VDVPAAPTVVLERPAPCRDAVKAEELLRRVVAPALAPRSSWSVIARFTRRRGGLAVEGEITDEVDAPVAHRVLTEPGVECSSLARAVGVWATLVLDAEVERAARTPPPSPPQAPQAPVVEPTREPPPEAPDRPTSVLLAHADGERTIELGVSAFLMGGIGSGVLAGPTLFGIFEVGRGWFLRPGILVGRTLEGISAQDDVFATLVAARFDACGRIPGFYIEHHGIQLDVCGGGEVGFQLFDAWSSASGSTAPPPGTLALLALGPSVSFRGELGSGLAVALRGVLDFNLLYAETGVPTGDPFAVVQSPFVGRGELGLSWQFR